MELVGYAVSMSGQVHRSDPGPEVQVSRARRGAAAVLAVPMVLALMLGLLDPLEGGMALLVGLALAALVWALSRAPVPRWAWIAALAAVALGAASLVWAGTTQDDDGHRSGSSGVVLGVLVVGYELAALATLAGGVVLAVRVVREARGPRPGRLGSS